MHAQFCVAQPGHYNNNCYMFVNTHNEALSADTSSRHCCPLTLYCFLSVVRYCILASKQAAAAPDEKTAAKVILDIIELDAEKYRLGHTKACLGLDSCLTFSVHAKTML